MIENLDELRKRQIRISLVLEFSSVVMCNCNELA